MILILKKGASKKEIEAIEKKIYKKVPGGFNAKKYNGILSSVIENPLTIQLKLRDEWERQSHL